MDNNKIEALILNWGLEPKTITSIYSSAWEINGCYVLKHGKHTAEIEKSLRLSKLLRAEGIPVTEYIETVDGQMFLSEDRDYYCLMQKLKGVHLDVFQSEQGLPFQLGEILARLHQALKSIEDKAVCQLKDLRKEWDSYIFPEIEQKNIDIPEEIVTEVQNWLVNVYPMLPRQLIHRDPHMGNLLFDGGELTGYIDFDLSVNNARIFDLCYFVLSFLIGSTDDAEKSRRWKSIFSDIVNGYETAIPLSDLEHQSFKLMMLYIELLFVAFWSGEGNAEQTEEAIKMAIWIRGNV